MNLRNADACSFGIDVNNHLIEGMARISSVWLLKLHKYISEPVLTETELAFGDEFGAYRANLALEPSFAPAAAPTSKKTGKPNKDCRLLVHLGR